ncbi:MAG: hypothetical protein N2B06_04845 [Clostridium sp.]
MERYCIRCFDDEGYLNKFDFCAKCEIKEDETEKFIYTNELSLNQILDVYLYKNRLYFRDQYIPY